VTTAPPRLVVVYGAVPAAELLRTEAARFHQVSRGADRRPARVPPVRQRRARAAVPADHGGGPRSGARQPRPRRRPLGGRRHRRRPGRGRRRGRGCGRASQGSTTSACTRASGARLPPTAPARGCARRRCSRRTGSGSPWLRATSERRRRRARGVGLAEHRAPGAVWLRDLAVPGHVVAVAVLPPADRTRATGRRRACGARRAPATPVARGRPGRGGAVGHGATGVDLTSAGRRLSPCAPAGRAADAAAARRGRGRRAAAR
jgi:hypothetical protein